MGAKILIIDDSLVVRTLVRNVVGAAGFEILEAADGPSGLAVAGAEAIDLFLVDLVMPGMGGLEVTRALRRLPGHGTTPIFVLTTEGHGAIAAEGTAAGADAWIVKPFEPDRLLIAIRQALGRDRPGA